MMKFYEHLDHAMERLHQKGAFLTTRADGKTNTMTISWGQIGFMWGKPVFMTMVRESRYTYELLKKTDTFTVSIPADDSFQKALGIAGSKSGRDTDKFALAGLTLKEGKKVATPVISGGGYTYECKILARVPVGKGFLPPEVLDSSYQDGDYHTFFYGEIVEAYKE